MITHWVTYALIAMLGFSGIAISIKQLIRLETNPATINFWFFATTAFGFWVLSLFQKDVVTLPENKTILVFLALSCSALIGNSFSVRAYDIAPNIGYAGAIISCSVIVLTIFSYYFFGADFSWLKFLGIMLCITGAIIISIG